MLKHNAAPNNWYSYGENNDCVSLQAQYSFIHDALDEFLTCGDNSIAVTNIRVAMVNLSKHGEGTLQTGYNTQFQVRRFNLIC